METSQLKLVIALDGSENALRAVRHVVRLANCGATLDCVLLNIQLPMELRIQTCHSSQVIRQMEANEVERILAPASEILSSNNVPHAQAYLVGDIADSIVAYAEKNRCAEIIMGMRGMGFVVGPVTMGSVTSKVIHEATVPVTLVK